MDGQMDRQAHGEGGVEAKDDGIWKVREPRTSTETGGWDT